MIDLSTAWTIVRESVRELGTERVALHQAFGRTLRTALVAPADLPPHHRSMLDGIALRQEDAVYADAGPMGMANPSSRSEDTISWLRIVEEIPAGVVPQQTLSAGEAARIMTGAMVPSGADAVVAIERVIVPHAGPNQASSFQGAAGTESVVGVERGTVKPNQNIQYQGAIAKANDVVLAAPRRLGSAEIGLAAEVGATSLVVSRRPRVAVITTGDELVEADQEPGPSQIRDSNGPMLAAALQAWSGNEVLRTHSRDDRNALDGELRRADEWGADVIVMAGGVSAGKLDLVPDRLEAFGATCLFHKVSLKPGKPIWFGIRERVSGSGESRRQWILGLPGNPISSLIGAELFVAPLLQALEGRGFVEPVGFPAKLLAEFTHKGDRPTYWPAALSCDESGWSVRALEWLGSADLPRVAQADGWIAFPAGTATYRADTTVRFLKRTMF